MKKDNEDIFKKIASQYMEEDGKQLKREMENLEDFPYDFTSLDKKVKEKVTAEPSHPKFKKYFPYGIAAAVLILVMIPVYEFTLNQEHTPNLSASSEEGFNENDIIALSFELPDNFEITKTELDKGQTIYYIADSNLDNVVMSVEKANDNKLDDFLQKTELDGTDVYYKSLTDYQIVEVNKDGLLYTLTCKHEIDTIMDIAKKITEI